MNKIANVPLDFSKIEFDLRRLESSRIHEGKSADVSSKTEFFDLLKKGVEEVNLGAKEAEDASLALASGKTSNIHETMLAVTKAEIGLNMMVQLRNKMLEAYQEVMKMQV